MQNAIKNWKLKTKGYVTITVLILMMVLSAITYLFADAVYAELAIARNNKSAQAAFALAEAGVQETIYKVKYDTVIRQHFLAGTPDDSFTHSAPALLTQGSYEVTIDNTAPGVATITSTGNYAMGLRTAKRIVRTVIAEATVEHAYDEAIFTHSTNAGEATGDVELNEATIQIFGSGISSGRDISIDESNIETEKSIKYGRNKTIDDSTIKCDCLIDPDGDPLTLQCSEAPQCTPTLDSTPGEMPMLSFPTYKSQAQNTPGPSPDGNQYFDNPNDFLNLVSAGTNTFNGVIYIDGALKIDAGQNITINGLLLAQSITLGKNSGSAFTTLTINNPGNNLSGVAVENDFIVNPKGNFTATGIVYALIKTKFEGSSPNSINLTGGILSRRLYVTDRTLIVHFNMDIIDTVLGSFAPVIEINHWEEEY